MAVTFTRTFTRANTNIDWPQNIREIDDHIALAHPSCTAWRVTSFSDDGLSFNYTSTWASIQELEAASEDEIVFSNIYAINTYCENNGIKAEHSIS
jgi:hypothetical protein